MSDGDGDSSDRTAPGTEDDEGVKVSIPDDFSDSTASPVRDFTPPSVRSVRPFSFQSHHTHLRFVVRVCCLGILIWIGGGVVVCRDLEAGKQRWG